MFHNTSPCAQYLPLGLAPLQAFRPLGVGNEPLRVFAFQQRQHGRRHGHPQRTITAGQGQYLLPESVVDAFNHPCPDVPHDRNDTDNLTTSVKIFIDQRFTSQYLVNGTDAETIRGTSQTTSKKKRLIRISGANEPESTCVKELRRGWK